MLFPFLKRPGVELAVSCSYLEKAEVKCWDLKLVLEPDSWKFSCFLDTGSLGGHCFTKSISSSSSQYSRLFERREEKKMYVERAKEATPPRERRSKLYSNPLRKICHCKNASYSFTLKQNNCTPANSVHILLLGLFIYYLCFTLLLHVCTLWEGWDMPQYMCGKLKDFWSWFSFHIFYLKFFFI